MRSDGSWRVSRWRHQVKGVLKLEGWSEVSRHRVSREGCSWPNKIVGRGSWSVPVPLDRISSTRA